MPPPTFILRPTAARIFAPQIVSPAFHPAADGRADEKPHEHDDATIEKELSQNDQRIILSQKHLGIVGVSVRESMPGRRGLVEQKKRETYGRA